MAVKEKRDRMEFVSVFEASLDGLSVIIIKGQGKETMMMTVNGGNWGVRWSVGWLAVLLFNALLMTPVNAFSFYFILSHLCQP